MLPERSFYETVRDTYLDAVTDVILGSRFRGRIRFYLEHEWEAESRYSAPNELSLHVAGISPATLEIILNSPNTYEVINLYMPE